MKVEVILVALLAALTSGSKLNVPRVLLPFSEEGTSFTLFADQKEKGCFKWKSSRPELVSITPLEEDPALGCSAKAEVRSLSKTWSKTQAVITAEDVHGAGHVLRCDVIVDRIESLQIVTKTHELYLEEAPEEFAVRAYDAEGNEFSTLDKMIFKWSIDVAAGKGSDNCVRFINFRDSTYLIDPALRSVEASGKQGCKVLLEGIKTGSSKVTVRVASTSYAKVPPVSVNIMVVANLYLVPGHAYVMMGSTVKFHAEQIKSNKIYQVSLPSQQYFLAVDKPNLGRLETDTKNEVTGLELGMTEVYLKDSNVGPDDSVRPPTSELHIVAPRHLTISISPYNNWHVVVGKEYELSVDIFDSEGNKLFPSDNLVMKMDISSEFFKVSGKSDNGTWLSGTPLKPGLAEVRAELFGVKDRNGRLVELDTHLTATGTLEIFDGIVLDPRLVVFPWDPVTRPSYDVKYEAISGSGGAPFAWSSSNTTVATVTQNGIAKTTKDYVGQTQIRAAMNKASHNFGQGDLYVLPSAGLKFLDHVLEVEIGSTLPVPLKMFAFYEGKRHDFSRCNGLPIKYGLSDEKIFGIANKDDVAAAEKVAQACTAVNLDAQSPGFTKLKAAYSFPAFETGKAVNLKDDITVAAYKPLTPVQPSTGESLITVDSSLHVVWTGGPLPWIDKPERHFHEIVVQDTSVVEVSQRLVTKGAVSNGLFVFEVKCSQLGETKVTLTVGNRKSATLPEPTVVSSEVKIVCGTPEQIELVPEVPQPEDTTQPCPLNARTGRIAAVAYEDVKVKVSVMDASGNKFDNVSSLEINWKTSDKARGKLSKSVGVTYLNSDKNWQQNPGYKPIEDAYQIIETSTNPGPLDLSAELQKSASLLASYISAKLQLSLVNDATVDPTSKSIFNHPDNRESASVKDGSGFFEVSLPKGQNVAEAKFFISNATVAIRPLNDGDVVVTVHDLCLKARKSPQVKVHVTGVHRVDLVLTDKVQRGNVVNAQVKLLDQHGGPISPSALKYVKVDTVPASKLVKLTHLESENSDLLYHVRGMELGETTVTATASYGSHSVASLPMPVQVFPPLELEPRNITLIIGAKFQARVVGGPNTGSDLEFSLVNDKIAGTNQVGLVEALTLGTTRLQARAMGVDKVTGQPIAYSEDAVDVHVVKFRAVRIHAPLTKLRVGGEMPVMLYGTDEHQNPYSYGSAIPNLDISWDVGSTEAAELNGVYYRNGLLTGRDNQGVMRLVAKKPGRVTIKVRAKITKPIDKHEQYQFDRDREFTDSLEIQVFEDLSLKAPWLAENTLLMSPNSYYQLRTNRDTTGDVTYTVMSKADRGEAVAVTPGGLVKAGKNPGSSLILVEDRSENGLVNRMSVIVDVKPISYMMLHALPAFNLETDSALEKLPKGLNLPLKVSYHDNTGMRFDTTNAETANRPSRFDTLVIREELNGTLNSELIKEEYTVFRAWSGLSNRLDLQDFVIMDVERGISPDLRRSILVGDVVDLDNLIVSDTETERNDGRWVAEPEGVVDIDAKTGLAVVLRSGQARISYHIGNGQKTSLDFSARPAARIQIAEESYLPRIPSMGFKASVAFVVKSDNGNESSNFHGNREGLEPGTRIVSTLFNCQAKFVTPSSGGKRKEGNKLSDLFSVRAVFSADAGSYLCEFTPKSTVMTARAALIADEVEVSVVPVSHSNMGVAADRRILRFAAGHHVNEEVVTVTNSEPSTTITVQGLLESLMNLQAETSNGQFLRLGRDYYEGSNTRIFPVHLRPAFWTEAKPGSDPLTVTFKNEFQSSKVEVKVAFAGDTCSAGAELSWSSLLYFLLAHYQSLLFIILSCVICVVVTRLLLANAAAAAEGNDGKTATMGGSSLKPNNSILQGQSLLQQSPLSPNRGHNLTNGENKPFLWTVDNSPVYGSPPVNRKSPRPMTQYSYSNQ